MRRLTRKLTHAAVIYLKGKIISLFGQNISDQQAEVALMKQQIIQMRQELTKIKAAIIEVSSATGGDGWVESMQNAVQGLDNKIDVLWNTAQAHHEVIEDLKESREQFWSQSLGLEDPKLD